jgi:gamma-glutamylcyclotransferase (GGCT)/AIG2-like uncharacterized protein YtfP
MKHLFVYGTLKIGFRNQTYLHDAIFLGEFTTQERYSMYDFETYPAVTGQGNDAIFGEVYQITSNHLAATDALECYPDYYQRISILTPFGDAWMYIVEQSLCLDKPKLSGNWQTINDD